MLRRSSFYCTVSRKVSIVKNANNIFFCYEDAFDLAEPLTESQGLFWVGNQALRTTAPVAHLRRKEVPFRS
jgi:hypothetical protein